MKLEIPHNRNLFIVLENCTTLAKSDIDKTQL